MRLGQHGPLIAAALTDLSRAHADKKRFLDIGCGGGNRTVLFEGPGREIHGFDAKDWREPALKDRIAFRLGDMMTEPLPYPDGFFDLVFSFDVFEHVPHPERIMSEAKRVLAPGGVFLLSTPNKWRPAGVLLIPLGLRRFPAPIHPASIGWPYPVHIMEYTAGELAAFGAAAGFELRRMHRLFYGLTSRLGIDRLGLMPMCHNLLAEYRVPERPAAAHG
ncbi:MAG: class I SAM-dependent methyltransferase [Spirochaetes bacterium]|nr:class I SAM-dependent methyltransferase [Spirochaetota bacterium]